MRTATVVLAGLLAGGCAQLGFSNRVLITRPSPTDAIVFVCQEVPEFDGPGHEWRLQKRDGTRLRRFFQGSDGNGRCDDAVWSDDGATLAIVVRGTIHIADVEWTLAHPGEKNTHWFVRPFSFENKGLRGVAHNVRFAGRGNVKFELSGQPFDLVIPSPLVPARRT